MSFLGPFRGASNARDQGLSCTTYDEIVNQGHSGLSEDGYTAIELGKLSQRAWIYGGGSFQPKPELLDKSDPEAISAHETDLATYHHQTLPHTYYPHHADQRLSGESYDVCTLALNPKHKGEFRAIRITTGPSEDGKTHWALIEPELRNLSKYPTDKSLGIIGISHEAHRRLVGLPVLVKKGDHQEFVKQKDGRTKRTFDNTTLGQPNSKSPWPITLPNYRFRHLKTSLEQCEPTLLAFSKTMSDTTKDSASGGLLSRNETKERCKSSIQSQSDRLFQSGMSRQPNHRSNEAETGRYYYDPAVDGTGTSSSSPDQAGQSVPSRTKTARGEEEDLVHL
jgi:hypothetical protein